MAELHGVHAEFRQARYHCVIVFVRDANDPDPVVAHGKWEGQVTLEPRGTGGFGYDPIFLPAGLHSTAAQLAPEQKKQDQPPGPGAAGVGCGAARERPRALVPRRAW